MNKKPVFWIIAGTAEGRKLAEKISDSDAFVCVSLATEYGRWFIQQKENLFVTAERLDKDEMASFINEKKIDCVIDATHPYAREVTKNIVQACGETGTKLLRLLRPQSEKGEFIYAKDSLQAAEILRGTSGRIFLTTGSKEIEVFTSIPDFQNRIYLRVLPIPDVIEKCVHLGFKAPNIICMQGPFSKELNVAMMRSIGAEILVTKDSGDTGGFTEKIEAADMLGMKVIVIGRPVEEQGLTYQDVLEKLIHDYGLEFYQVPENENHPYFPMFVSLKGKKVKVFGAGVIAARRVKCLLQFGALVEVIAPRINPELWQLQELTISQRPYQENDCASADLVIAATDDSSVNRNIALECNQYHIPVSVADNKELCSFYFPAVVKENDFVIGITSSGRDHSQVKKAAARIRLGLDEILG
ncbi:MAG: precorrin-6A reductase [Peptococcaceae bacterium]|nr:precorrin-6A reductase [Peptococcaceae bacterium]